VRALRPETPDWLADLVHGLLAKSPDDRPAGAATVAEALAARESIGGATTVLPAAIAPTTQRLDAVPPPVLPPTGPMEPERRGIAPLTWVLGAVAVAVIALLLWLLLKDDGQTPATTPSSTPSTSQPATSEAPPTTKAPTKTPSATPTETPTPTPTPTADPADAVATSLSAFSDEVGVLERDGVMDKDAAKTLDGRVRDVQKALRDADPEKVSEERDKLVEDYDKGVQDGSIPAEATQQLDPLLADVNDAVDAYVAG